ncbi:MAG: alpha/beta hydrolase [Pirellulales bacterium]
MNLKTTWDDRSGTGCHWRRTPCGRSVLWGILLMTSALAADVAAADAAAADPVREIRTMVYKHVGPLEIQADVVSFRDGQVRPVVVWLHGGALINGHRDSVPGWLSAACATHGNILVSLDYRLAPETSLPAIIEDLEDAFRWIREQGPAEFHADPHRIAVVGGSAGGYLTLTAGFRVQPPPTVLVALWGYGDLVGDWYSRPSPHPVHQQIKLSADEAWKQVRGPAIADARQRAGNGSAFYQFCRQQGLWPRAVTGWDPHQEPEKFFPYMAVKNVTPTYPPTLLIHGDQDTDVPFEQSLQMVAQFRQHQVPHRLLRVAGAEHGLAGVPPEVSSAAYAEAVRFLQERLDAKKPAP